LEDGHATDQGPIEKKGRKAYAVPSIVVLDVSRLGSAGQAPVDASWMVEFQDILGCL